MKKLTSFGAVALAAIIAVLAMAGFQSPAQAYPDVQIDLTVNRQVVHAGESFTATGSANVSCDWTLRWNGSVRTAHRPPNVDYVTSYTAPAVNESRKFPLQGTCSYSSSTAGPTTWQRTIVITVLPSSRTAVAAPHGSGSGQHGASSAPRAGTTGGGSDLASTGGPDRLFLAAGLVLLVTGATAVTLARRRAEAAEIRASRGPGHRGWAA